MRVTAELVVTDLTDARELLHPGWFPSPPRCVAQCQSVVAHGEVSLAVLGEGVRETKVRLELSLSPSGVRQNNGDRVGMIRRSSQPASPNMRPQTLHGLGTQPDASNKSSEDEITAAAGDSDSDTSTAVDSSNGEISSTSKKLATQRIPRAPSVTEGFDARGDELRKLIKDWPMPSGAWDAGCDDGQHWPSNWLEIGIVSTNEGDRPLSRDEIRNNELRCVIKSWPVATGIWVSKDTGDARIQWPRSWAPASDLVTRGPDVDQSLAEVELQSKSQGKRRRGKRGKRGGRKRK